MDRFGDHLNNLIHNTKRLIFTRGEAAQLAFISFDRSIEHISSLEEGSSIPISVPLGYRNDETTVMSDPQNYSKNQLLDRYKYLMLEQLPINEIFQLVTIIETFLNDILRSILIEYPNKIPSQKKIQVDYILSANSIESIKLLVADDILNEIAYNSPKDYATEFNKFTGINLLENPSFHKYVELKATRDIHIHNRGVANEVYLGKSGPSSARAEKGEYLIVDIKYFLKSYENCLKLNEFLEIELDKIWPSEEFRKRKSSQQELTKDDFLEETIDQSKNKAK